MSKKKKHTPILKDFPRREKTLSDVRYIAVCGTAGCGFTGLPMDARDLTIMRLATAFGMIDCPRCEGNTWHYHLSETVTTDEAISR